METKERNKKKVLFMIDTLGGGGAEKVLIYILRDMNRLLFDIDLFLVIKEGVYLPDIPADVTCNFIFKNASAIRFRPFRLLYRLYRRSMLELFKIFPFLLSSMSEINQNYDIGISFCEGHNTPLLSLKSGYFQKTVAWIHVDLKTHRCPLGRERLRSSLKSVDKIFFVSKGAMNGFIDLFPEFGKRSGLGVIYNPINAQEILTTSSKAPEITKKGLTLLAIGRLSHQKRFDKLLRIHRQLLDEGLYHQVWILGEGEDRRELEAQCRNLGITNSCFLLGFCNIYSYLKSADVFVMTSDYEGLPVALCEAMILCKPIVSTNVTGPRELLENGKFGLLVENNEYDICLGVKKMIINPELRESYSRKLKNNRDFIFPIDLLGVEQQLLKL